MTLGLVFALLVAQPASCTPVSRNTTLDVSFKKGARVKDVVAWLSKVNCSEYDVWPGLETNALTLVVEGKLPATGIELFASTLLESGGARLVRVGPVHRIRRRLGPCDPVAARAALSSARSKGGCVLDLTRFGDPMTFGECLDHSVKLGEKDEAGRFPVEHLGTDALLRAIGVEEHDLLVDPIPEPPDRHTTEPASPFSISLVRAGKPMTLECSIVGDGESLALHPAHSLRSETRDSCAIPESAVTARGEVMEVSPSTRLTPECLSRAARFVPVARDGGFSVKLYAIRRGSFFAALGFANGDEVRTVNGAPLSGTPEQVLSRLKGEKRFVVELVRRGEPKTITVAVTGK